MLHHIKQKAFGPIFSPLPHRTSVHHYFICLFPRPHRPIPPGLIISFNPLRIRFVSLTSERLDKISIHVWNSTRQSQKLKGNLSPTTSVHYSLFLIYPEPACSEPVEPVEGFITFYS